MSDDDKYQENENIENDLVGESMTATTPALPQILEWLQAVEKCCK